MNTLSSFYILLLLSAVLMELGRAAGLIPPDVLDAVNGDLASWWRRGSWVHGLAAFLYAAVFLLTVSLSYAGQLSRVTRGLVAFAAALLCTHLSPVYIAAPNLFPYGGLVALFVLILVVKPSGRHGWPPAGLPSGRGSWALAALGGVTVLVTFINQFGEMAKLISNVTDFRMFYEAAEVLRTGGDPYAATGGGYFYPPTFAFYLRSITWLPPAGASLLWFVLKLSMLFPAYRMVFQLADGTSLGRSARQWFIFGMLLVAARFVVTDLQYGNTNTFVLCLLIAAVYLDLKDRPFRAGAALAVAVCIKVVPALFLVYLAVRGRWKSVMWTAAFVAAFTAVPLLVEWRASLGAWAGYMETGVAGKLGDSLSQPDNQSLWGALNRLLDSPLSTTRVLWLVLSLLLIAKAAVVTRALRDGGTLAQARAASLFFVLGLLVSPGSWVVHYAAVLLPMTCLLRLTVDRQIRTRFLVAVFVLANVAFTLSGLFRITVRLSIEQSWFVLAGIFLFFALTKLNRQVYNRQSPSGTPTG